LFPFDFLLQPLQTVAKECGHGRTRGVVVEIIRRLVARVAPIEATIPFHFAPPGGRLDLHRHRIGTDRQSVEIGIGHPIAEFESGGVILVETFFQRRAVLERDLAFRSGGVATRRLDGLDARMPAREPPEFARDRPDCGRRRRDDNALLYLDGRRPMRERLGREHERDDAQ
jgi:hypothetical protein